MAELSNKQIEASVLTACMNSDPAVTLERLTEDDFTSPEHFVILDMLRKAEEKDKQLDALIINDLLISMKRETYISYAIELYGSYFPYEKYSEHLNRLKEYTVKRKIHQSLIAGNQWLKDDMDIRDLKSNLLELISDIPLPDDKQKDEHIGSIMLKTMEDLEDRAKNKDNPSNKTGLVEIDKAMGGLWDGELTIVAARPSVGKTALACQIAKVFATNGKTVQMFSLEMMQTQVAQRFLSSIGYIDGQKFRTGNIEDKDWERIVNGAAKSSILPIYINESARTVAEIRTKCRERKEKNGLDLIIIDYLQLIENRGRYQNREQEVSNASRAIKTMTIEFGVPIILLSQLNRNAAGKRPGMADLRESGAIEQDADNILFLHRPETSELQADEIEVKRVCNEHGKDYLEAILDKQRNGRTGMFPLMFAKKYLEFQSIFK